MAESHESSPPTAKEDLQPITVPDGLDGPASIVSLCVRAESEADALDAQLRGRMVEETCFQEDSVGTPPAENLPEATNEVTDVRISGAAVPFSESPEREIVELHAEIKRIISQRIHLPHNVASMVSFWAISTWFQEAFAVFPLLVIIGPAHEAMVILRVLRATDIIGRI